MDKNKRREMRLKFAACSGIVGVMTFLLLVLVMIANLAGMQISNSATVVLGIVMLAMATLSYALQLPDGKANSFHEDDDFNPWKDY
ncbi:hypothetical protein EOM60_04995 [Candidatus Saccharibacteria bacterium]|jgi:hypothetical protein|nr:hypothetical protein [Candidatus Saccharibacteria bacterium]